MTAQSDRPDPITDAVARLRAGFDSGKTRPLRWRRDQLRAIAHMVETEEAAIADAIHADLRKSRTEVLMTELGLVRREALYAAARLRRWAARRTVATPLIAQPGRSWLQPQPLGVVLNIGSWNYPWQQALQPMAGALAAGNAMLVKPSELAPHSAALMADLLPRYLDPEAIAVVQGGAEETTALLTHRFDHILYTGGGTVGRIVMQAAARHLTPVTLELGGKCPVIVDQTADIALAARRIIWAKLQNCGQICINADYVLVHASHCNALADAMRREIRAQLGDDAQASPDYGRIINARHHDRLTALLDQGRILHGGRHDRADLFIEPTLIDRPTPGGALMRDEIFGPILPVLEWEDEAALLARLRAQDTPLALYVFSRDRAFQDRMIAQTASGMAAINDLMLFAAVPGLPFGGLGASGMGAYGGQRGFDSFSHLRPVVRRGAWPDLSARYAPMTAIKEKILRLAWR